MPTPYHIPIALLAFSFLQRPSAFYRNALQFVFVFYFPHASPISDALLPAPSAHTQPMHSDEMLTVDDDTPPAVASPATTNSDSQAAALPKLTKSGQPDQRSARSPARLAANRNNAKTAGIPKGTQLPTKRTLAHVQERAIEAIATAAIESGHTGLKPHPLVGPVTAPDRAAVSRLMGMPAEDFQTRMAATLERLADKIGQRMEEKLDADLYKPAELNMAMAISIDKHAALSGRNALKGASVNIQVNNFGDATDKDALIREIRGAMDVVAVKLE